MREKLSGIFMPSHMDILNESPDHGLPREAEKHFRVVLVSETFRDQNRIERHRLVHEVLSEELKAQIHALSVHAYTPEEWRARKESAPESPECLGGGKKEGRW